MARVVVREGARETTLDACERCMLVWFDADEMEALPAPPLSPPPRKFSAADATAVARITAAHRDDAIAVDMDPWGTETLAGLSGLPTKVGAPDSGIRPWLTWSLATLVLALTVTPLIIGWFEFGYRGAYYRLNIWVQEWGFVPAAPSRHGGLTLVTSFFVHSGWLHALFNAYFLTLAGEDVEGRLGRSRYLLLLLASTLGCEIVHLAANVGSAVPAVGASGGISGLFAYYALALPGVSLGFTLGSGRSVRVPRFVQVRVSVRWVFGLWIAGQVLFGLLGAGAATHVAYAGHIGGALAGAGWWAVERRRHAPRANP